ncbi:GGDEF domain-containing protein [Actinotalea soli]|uniref:GGDEF domain-containing protein n=1 Tax=Actinotalea soli TaxID=2819234 RepID=UPI0027DB62DA|nr:GGDEF domain-containing protein [Actinotalea soli]
MTLVDALEPRDRVVAGRVAATLTAIGSVVLVAYEGYNVVIDRPGTTVTSFALAVVVALLLVLVAVSFRRRPMRMPRVSFVALPVVATLVVTAFNVGTQDASTAARFSLTFAVVYAGGYLRAPAAWFVMAVATACDAVVVLAVLPPSAVASELVIASVAFGALTGVLVSAGRRNDVLVAELNRWATTDSLTGLASRRAFEQAARELLDSPDQGRGTGLLVIDLDRFKDLNDAYGHPAGDAALVHVAQVLRGHVRPQDLVARLGGDELAVLLPEVDGDALGHRAEALRHAVQAEPMVWDGAAVPLSLSAGGAHVMPGRGDAPAPMVGGPRGLVPPEGVAGHAEQGEGRGPRRLEVLYRAADAALYRAKREGRDRVEVVSVPADHAEGTARPPVDGLARPSVGSPADAASPAVS